MVPLIGGLVQASRAIESSERAAVASRLPKAYSEDFMLVSGNLGGKKFDVVCAEPNHAPGPVETPPFVKLFLLKMDEPKPRLVASATLGHDNLCLGLAIHNSDQSNCVVAVVSRPYAGSVYRNNLRLFRWKVDTNSLKLDTTVNYVDGVSIALPAKESGLPAYLVYEPIFGSRSKCENQPFRFRLYEPTKDGKYMLKLTLKTKKYYKLEPQAYAEVVAKLRRSVGSDYSVPKTVPGGSDIEKDDGNAGIYL